MTMFKICGLRNVYHAIVAADAGADFLGFNFVEGVRRQLQPDEAENLINDYRSREKNGEPALVGLFANQPANFINSAIQSKAAIFASCDKYLFFGQVIFSDLVSFVRQFNCRLFGFIGAAQ